MFPFLSNTVLMTAISSSLRENMLEIWVQNSLLSTLNTLELKFNKSLILEQELNKNNFLEFEIY